jgi:hypothetical protein
MNPRGKGFPKLRRQHRPLALMQVDFKPVPILKAIVIWTGGIILKNITAIINTTGIDSLLIKQSSSIRLATYDAVDSG